VRLIQYVEALSAGLLMLLFVQAFAGRKIVRLIDDVAAFACLFVIHNAAQPPLTVAVVAVKSKAAHAGLNMLRIIIFLPFASKLMLGV
jgi:hypothetical protein